MDKFPGGDNFTRMLGCMATHLQDVNVNMRSDDGVWSLAATAKRVSGEGLFDLVDLCREIDATPALMNEQFLVLGKH